MELNRVVVTGIGAVTPLGNTAEETWQSLLEGKSGAAPFAQFNAANFKTQFGCEVKNLDVEKYINRKDARKMDRCTQLAIISAIQGVNGLGKRGQEPHRSSIWYRYRWNPYISG